MTDKAANEEGGFAALLADLETLAKACPDDTDEKVEAAAEDGDAEGGEGNNDQSDADPDDDGDDDKTFGKSFEVVLADGTKAGAIDGTAMMKALHEENVAMRSSYDEMGRTVTVMGSLIKSMHTAQAENTKLIKSLRSDLAKLGSQGSGRRAVVNVLEKKSATPEAPVAPSQDQIMAKAMALQTTGKLSGSDVNRVFTYTTRNLGVPADLAHHFTA